MGRGPETPQRRYCGYNRDVCRARKPSSGSSQVPWEEMARSPPPGCGAPHLWLWMLSQRWVRCRKKAVSFPTEMKTLDSKG